MNLMTPETPSTNTVVETITYATGECALGRVLVARSIKGVCAILIGDDQKELETD